MGTRALVPRVSPVLDHRHRRRRIPVRTAPAPAGIRRIRRGGPGGAIRPRRDHRGGVSTADRRPSGGIAMTGYTAALFVHLLGVVTLFAGIALQQSGAARLRAATTADEVRLWIGFLRPTAATFPAAVVILVGSG